MNFTELYCPARNPESHSHLDIYIIVHKQPSPAPYLTTDKRLIGLKSFNTNGLLTLGIEHTIAVLHTLGKYPVSIQILTLSALTFSLLSKKFFWSKILIEGHLEVLLPKID